MYPPIDMPFIPSSLRKLREIAGCTEAEAAKRVQKDVETIIRWESDEYDDLPNYAQANALSDLYRYDVLMCMREIPPQIRPPEVPDFRTLDRNGTMASDFSSGLRWLLRMMAIRQGFVREYGPYWELQHQDWVGSQSIRDVDPETLAGKMRRLLRISVTTQRGFPQGAGALNEWITAFNDNAGVFVCQTSNQGGQGIELDEMRGLSLADAVAPFIVVNSKDAEAGRIFTLFHEFTHLWIGRTGLSGMAGLQAKAARNARNHVESFCDETAANALMPEAVFNARWNEHDRRDAKDTVQTLSREFRVSRDAVAVRAAKLSRISWMTYTQFRKDFGSEGTNSSHRASSGGNYYLTHRRNLGRKYAELVVATWLDGQISIKQAAYYLDLRPGQVYSFARTAGYLA